MKILAIDSSAVSAGCAVMADDKIIAESFLNIGLTHSETLLPMIQSTLSNVGIKLSEIDCCAVSNGPGSFTGIRIGVAAVKGLAFAENIPCIGVSTLEVIAWNGLGFTGTICAAMDARRSQVYNALFSCDGEHITRLCEDRAISIEELKSELLKTEGDIYLAGDGAELCSRELSGALPAIKLLPQALRYQRGAGVAMAARGIYLSQGAISPAELVPTYLRPSQAERELKKA